MRSRVSCRNSSHSARCCEVHLHNLHSFYSVRHRRRCRPAHLLCPAQYPQVVFSSTFQTVKLPAEQRPRSPSPRPQRRSTSSVSLPRTSAQPGPLGQASARAADRVVAKNSCLTPWTATARRTSASASSQRTGAYRLGISLLNLPLHRLAGTLCLLDLAMFQNLFHGLPDREAE
jgi:hypothetical protein